jgi:hypothetical protein
MSCCDAMTANLMTAFCRKAPHFIRIRHHGPRRLCRQVVNWCDPVRLEHG